MARRAAPANELSNVPDEVWVEALTYQAEAEVIQMRANAKRSAAIRKFEAQGIDWGAVKLAHQLKKMEPTEREARLTANTRAMRAAGISWDSSGQASFEMGDPPSSAAGPPSHGSEKLARARAFADGYNSGRHGATLESNPFAHMPGSEEYVRWRDGWEDGQADRILLKPEKANETSPAPRRGPGRPRKVPVPEVPTRADGADDPSGIF